MLYFDGADDIVSTLAEFNSANEDYLSTLALKVDDIIREVSQKEIPPSLFELYSNNLIKAIDSVYSDKTYKDLAEKLRENVKRFAAYKAQQVAYLCQTAANGDVDMMKGFIRVFNRYQAVEHNTARSRARTAKQWNEFDENKGLFPNIKWILSRSVDKREEHIVFAGRVWAKDDPFWTTNQPGSLWNCKCDWQETDEPVTDGNPSNKRIVNKGLEGNPAVTGEIFTDNASYIQKSPNPQVVEDFLKSLKPKTRKPSAPKPTAPNPAPETSDPDDLISKMPNNLTNEEKKAIANNIIELEKALNIKSGNPMSIEDADNQNANPKHNPEFIKQQSGYYTYNTNYNEVRDYPFSINCQTCSPAYMLRLRGLNITAGGNTPGSLQEHISRQRSFELWLNPDGTKPAPALTRDWMAGKGYLRMTPKRYKKYFEEITKDEGVYLLTVGWQGGGGHATILQRLKNGKLVYIEPQEYYSFDGTFLSVDEITRKAASNPVPTRGILRIDNKIFNTKYASIFETSK